MGEKLAGNNEQSERTVIPERNPSRPTAGNSSTPTSGTGNAGGNSPANGTGKPTAGTAPEKEEKLSGLAPVKETPPTPENPKKAQKRKSKPKKKEPEPSFNADQLSALILSMSAIVGSRPGMEVWMLRPEEAKQLATPISNMVQKSEKLSQLSEHADAMALVSASLVIFAPRAVVFYDQQKKKKIERNGGVQLVREKPKSDGSNRKPVQHGSADVVEHATDFRSAIPPTIF